MQVAIQRHTQAVHINAILNHPEVYPHVSFSGSGAPLDLTAFAQNPDVYILLGEHGGQVYWRLQPGLFDVHSQCLPEGRGEWMLQATRETLAWMFTRTEAVEIVGRCPKDNLATKALVKAVGGVHRFTNPYGWMKNGKPIATEIFSLTMADWIETAPGLAESGARFLRRLASELPRRGVEDGLPDVDDMFERQMGAAWETLIGGQPHKAAVMWNRYAAVMGQPGMAIVQADPLSVELGMAVIVVRGSDFQIASMAHPPMQEA